MSTEEDLKKTEAEGEPEEGADDAEVGGALQAERDAKIREATGPSSEEDEDEDEDGEVPVQLGYKRYVYAAYMAFAMLVAFLAAKIGHTAWYRLGQWKAELGEPQDEILFPLAAIVGIAVAMYYWRRPQSREYVNEVAEELSQVTWPSRKEVTNSTTIVVLTTLFATVFFALMDRFWGFVTDHIYSF